MNKGINYENTIPDFFNKLECEIERNKIKESKNISIYRNRMRKRNMINKSLPSEKINWFFKFIKLVLF